MWVRRKEYPQYPHIIYTNEFEMDHRLKYKV